MSVTTHTLITCTAGIDKPNIRRIIHYGAPATLEAYYQQVCAQWHTFTQSCYMVLEQRGRNSQPCPAADRARRA